jgi:hypothetical protein
MNVFLGVLLSTLSPQHMQVVGQPMRDLYQMSHSGPLMDTTFLAHLSTVTQTFLPGSQIHSVIEILLQQLKDTWQEFFCSENDQAIHGEGWPKKRKVEVDATSLRQDAPAISFSLSSQIASVVVSSLAMQSVAQVAQHEIGRRLSDLGNLLIHYMSKTFKAIRKRPVWSSQIVTAASLRLLYTLEVSQHPFFQIPNDSKLWEKVSGSLLDEELLPELTVEIVCVSKCELSLCSNRFVYQFRTLLIQPSFQAEARFHLLFKQALLYIDQHFSTSVSWSGVENQGRGKGALVLLHIIIQKWLPLIEYLDLFIGHFVEN